VAVANRRSLSTHQKLISLSSLRLPQRLRVLRGRSLAACYSKRLKSILQELPPAMAFEISEAGIASARIGRARGDGFLPRFPPGALCVSPLKGKCDRRRRICRRGTGRWRPARTASSDKDVADIRNRISARASPVLDFDRSYPTGRQGTGRLVRFPLKALPSLSTWNPPRSAISRMASSQKRNPIRGGSRG